MSNPVDWLQVDATIGVAITIVGGTVGFFRWISRRIRQFEGKWDLFMRDWQGEAPAPGRDAVPGVMERLNKIDGELKHNGGSTMKDAIKRIETKLERIDSRIEKGDARFLEGAERFEKIESEIEELKRGNK
jgi:hypothetical protein